MRTKPSKSFRFTEAEFVCPDEVNSTVRARLMLDLWDDGEQTFETDMYFGDCNRVINWTGYGLEGAQTMLAKLDRTTKVINATKTALIHMINEADKHKKALKKKKKKDKRGKK